jgi:predicted ATP-grasp superfamily ATP-dependent carboligase
MAAPVPATPVIVSSAMESEPSRAASGRSHVDGGRDRPHVVVTGGEKLGVLAGVRALARAGYETWVTVSERGSYSARSRATAGTVEVPDPAFNPAGFVAAVTQAAANLVATVLPGTDKDLIAFAEHASLVPKGLVVGAPPRATVERATDKSKLVAFASSAGLQMPRTIAFHSEESQAVTAELGFPLVIKPLTSESRSADGILLHSTGRLARDEEGLSVALARLPGDRWLAQPYLEGSLYAVCGLAWRGQVVCSEHQIAARIWPRTGGNSAYATTIARHDELEEGVRRLVEIIGWEGIFQAQFIRHGTESYLIDFNPRMYGSLALAVAAGLNLPALWVELMQGGNPNPGEYRVGVRYREEENDVRALTWLLMHGRLREAARGLVPHRGTVHAVFSGRDPCPLLTTLGKFARLVTARRTIEA